LENVAQALYLPKATLGFSRFKRRAFSSSFDEEAALTRPIDPTSRARQIKNANLIRLN